MQGEPLFHKIFSPVQKLSPAAVFFVLAVLGLMAYANAINHPFVHDDIVFIQQNPHIGNLDVVQIFSATASPHSHPTVINTYWRPFLELTYRLQYRLFGFRASLYHLTNILIHITNSFFVYLLFLRFFKERRNLALVMSVIFLLHPVQSESVACVAGISNLLFAFFGFGSFLLYIDFIEKGRKAFFLLAIIGFLFSLLAKEQAVILPLLFLMYLVCFRSRQLRKKGLTLLGFFLAAGVYFFIRRSVAGNFVTSSLNFDHEFWLRITSIPKTLLMYWRLLLFPFDLHYYRNIDILAGKWLPAAVFLAIIVVLFVYVCRKRGPKTIYTFAVSWFFISLLPMLNIIPLTNEYSLILTAEHFLYVPMIGFFMFFVVLIDDYLAGKEKLKVYLFLSAVVAMLFLTVWYNRFWRSEVVLFERMVRFEKDFGRGHILLGKAYYFDGRYQEAIKAYEKAAAVIRRYIDNTSSREAKAVYREFMENIYFDLAHCHEALGQYNRANENYQRSMEFSTSDVTFLNNIGINYVKMRRPEEAAEYFQRALRFDPDNIMAKNNLATLYAVTGKKEKALRLYEEVLKDQPDNRAAKQNYQRLMSELKTE